MADRKQIGFLGKTSDAATERTLPSALSSAIPTPVEEAAVLPPPVETGETAAAGPAQGPARPRRAITGRWIQISYALIDLTFVCLNALVAFAIRFVPQSSWMDWPWEWSLSPSFPWPDYLGSLVIYAALVLLCCQSQDLYRTLRTRSQAREAWSVVKALTLATLLVTAFLFLANSDAISRLVLVFAALMNVTTLIAWRAWRRQVVIRRVAQGIGARNVLIVGAGRVGQALARYLDANPQLGYRVCGFLDGNHHEHPKMLGKMEDLMQVARSSFVDEVFITIPSHRELSKAVAVEAQKNRLTVKVVPELFDEMGWNAPLQHLGQFPVMELHREPIPNFGLFIKRLMDMVGSAAAIFFLAPLMALLAILIRFDSPGPILYRSDRVGRKGRRFVCYKFRTMVANADALKEELRHRNERNGPFFKIADDPRVTRLGRFLRKYSLDELPQFWNVLKGEMSLVGPRPHPVDDYEQYDWKHLRRLDVKPGITGLWQVTARQDPSWETSMALDLDYIENWNLWLDVRILLSTLPATLRGTGA